MPQHCCTGAMLQCTMGVAPSTLNVLPKNKMMTSNMAAANIMDNIPMVHIPPFGMCNSPANPTVAAATAAALGVLTPMPCVPVFPAPWAPGAPTVMLGNLPVLNNTSKLMCAYAGVVSINMAGQMTEMVP